MLAQLGKKQNQGSGSNNVNFDGDNSIGGGNKGFTRDQVLQARWVIENDDDEYFYAYRYVQNGDDITTLHKETGRF
ncbi:hypothetical protein [Taibaiella chishuiensis]|uniref:hypothetical protein n=1 Tax=Taibaiella chishuiensis TaxID=1434707 RepID=UPI0011B27E49|nr:hypothetical protein [Taibaiella chishuiensis]